MINHGRVTLGHMEAVTFGRSVVEALPEEIENCGAERIFLIFSETLDRTTNEVQKLRTTLGSKLVGQFSSIGAHTPREGVIAATKEVRDTSADILVTFGGGSITDGAKAVTLCLANDIFKPEDIDLLLPQKDSDGCLLPPDFSGPQLNQICIPTTLSAAEFTAVAGVTDQRTSTKEMLRHPDIMPHAVILDPIAAQFTPEWLFLSTGIRAIDHCVEGICSNEAHAFGDAFAVKGLSLLARGLPHLKSDPTDLAARLDCQIGAWMSAGPLVSGVPMGASHGIGYVLGARFGIPHGHTSCIMLPAVMRWNKIANSERQTLVADTLGVIDESVSNDAGDRLDALISGLGMPRNLNSVGINREYFQEIAELAMSTQWVPRNPRTIAGPAEIVEILELAA